MNKKSFREALALCRGLLDHIEKEPDIAYVDKLVENSVKLGESIRNNYLPTDVYLKLRDRADGVYAEERFDAIMETMHSDIQMAFNALPDGKKKELKDECLSEAEYMVERECKDLDFALSEAIIKEYNFLDVDE